MKVFKFGKILQCFSIMIFLTVGAMKPVLAFPLPETIRVGLEYRYKNVSSVPISNQRIAFGYEENGGFLQEGEASSATGFTAIAMNQYYTVLEHTYKTYQQAQEAAAGYQTVDKKQPVPICLQKGEWAICVGGFSTEAEAKSIAEELIEDTDIIPPAKQVVLQTDGVTVVVFGEGINPQVAAVEETGVATLDDRSYRGRIELGRYTASGLTAINVIGLEEYLYGVVPAEMPASYEKEALKAQAVAARTYALSRKQMGTHIPDGYEVCDNANCQMYAGYDSEAVAVNSCIEETRGILALYQQEPINAVFFASSGGYTEDSENVWLEAVGYMRGVPEFYEPDVNEWSRTFTAAELTALARVAGAEIGEVTDIQLTEIAPSGRVQVLTLLGTGGTKVLEKEEIRSFFAGNGGTLLSRMFSINGVGVVFPASTANTERTANKKAGVLVTDPEILAAPTVFVEGIGNMKLVPASVAIIGGDDRIYLEEDGKVYAYPPEIFQQEEEAPKTEETGKKPSETNTEGKTTDTEAFVPKTEALKLTIAGGSGSNTADGSGTFVLEGRGNGHGVGMSQKGANGMAKQGYTYQEILKHYYTGITLQ